MLIEEKAKASPLRRDGSGAGTHSQINAHKKMIAILTTINQSQRREQNKRALLTGVWGRLIADYRAKCRVQAEILFQQKVTERLIKYYQYQMSKLVNEEMRKWGTNECKCRGNPRPTE